MASASKNQHANTGVNILLITADDMNWDAVGAYGCPVAGTTPNLDRLASEGLRFEYAHITIAVCQPSRSALMTGRYPHNSGGEGFFSLRKPGVPILPDLLRRGGYRVGILGKVPHSTPYADFEWDMAYDQSELGMGRNPEVYYRHAGAFVRDAAQQGRPFFLMANSHDPHRPFYGNDREEWYRGDPPAVPPSRTFESQEVRTPGFLPDFPDVRTKAETRPVVLGSIFSKISDISLEFLTKTPRRDARRLLTEMGLDEYAAGCVMLFGLGHQFLSPIQLICFLFCQDVGE